VRNKLLPEVTVILLNKLKQNQAQENQVKNFKSFANRQLEQPK
jgi:hypothetical protein